MDISWIDVSGRVLAGERTEVAIPVVVRAADRGSPQQRMCTEMLHWDDYSAQRGLNAGAPTMASLFSTGGDGAASGAGGDLFRVKDQTYSTSKIIAANPACIGSAAQSLCAEMIHWDELRASRGMLPATEQPLSRQFRPTPVSRTYDIYDTVKNVMLSFETQNVALVKGDDERRSYCSEMEHYDDYCRQKGITQSTTMLKQFGSA